MGHKHSFSTVDITGFYTYKYSSGTTGSFKIGKTFQPETFIDTEDTPNRDWRRAWANGQTVSSDLQVSTYLYSPTPMSITTGQRRRSDGLTYEESYRGYPYDTLVGTAMFGGPSQAAFIAARNQALGNFYSRLSAVETSFKGMTFAGELRETLKMIRRPAQGLRDLLSSYLTSIKKNRGKWKTQKKRLQGVRSQWLEYQYGIRPLVSDTSSAIEALVNSNAIKPVHVMCRGGGYGTGSPESQTFVYFPVNNTSVLVDRKLYASVYFKVYGFYTNSGALSDGLRNWGFTYEEFIPTLWNLLPWSFVADYFSNVGTVLESYSYRYLASGGTVGTSVQDLNTELRTIACNRFALIGIDWEPQGFRWTPGSLMAKKRLIQRIDNFGVPPVSLTLKVPGTSTKWINLGALASQLADTRRALR